MDFENHYGDELRQVPEESTTCRARVTGRVDLHSWSFETAASLDPALHAFTLQKIESRATSASVEYAPAQLLVKNRQIARQRDRGGSVCQRGFFSCRAK